MLVYEVFRADSADGEYVKRGVAVKGADEYQDEDKTEFTNGQPNPGFIAEGKVYYYKVRAMAAGNAFHSVRFWSGVYSFHASLFMMNRPRPENDPRL